MRRFPDLKLVIFDMAGTTIDDRINNTPLIIEAYNQAFKRFGISVSLRVLNEQRGKDKRQVIKEYGGKKSEKIYAFFIDLLKKNIRKIKAIEDTDKTFRYLHKKGIKVAMNTGFPADITKSIIDHLGWEKKGLIDYWLCSELAGKSRPDPLMIIETMNHFGIKKPLSVLKIDDTYIGLEEGKRAGVITIGVLTGSQPKSVLKKADPYAIITSVKELPNLLKNSRITNLRRE